MTNIVLTGFMGSGKSTVGRLVAGCLGWPFVDMDERIAQRAGMSVPQIFARAGEARFRQLERSLCHELSAGRRQVIATGGGALIDAENRRRLAASGLVICLQASRAEIRHRLDGQAGRPLFGADWETLYENRAADYARIPHQVQSEGRAPAEIAGEVVRLWQHESG